VNIVTVVGARPQFVKAAVISRALQDHFPHIKETIVHTGQHYDPQMSALFFEQMEIPKPAYNLNVSGGSHAAMTARMLEGIERVLIDERPDWLIVYGDTNSTLAGSLAAAKLGVPIAHIESGLRSFNRSMPEEINRIVCDHCSSLLFAPTAAAVANLRAEGISDEKIVCCGDVMLDAAIFYKKRAPGSPIDGRYLLATVHRAGNVDDPVKLLSIFEGLRLLAQQMPVVLPLHPRTRRRIEEEGVSLEGIRAIEPVGYLEMVALASSAYLIATDSGGLQKEAFFFGVPCLVLREETEWVELVDGGFASLVGSCPKRISAGIDQIGRDLDWSVPLYGDGKSGLAIVERIAQ